MNVPKIPRQGVGMGRGVFSTIRRWVYTHARLIILGVGLALMAGHIAGCQSATSVKGAKSEASSQTGSTKFSIKTANPVQPEPVKVRVKVRETR